MKKTWLRGLMVVPLLVGCKTAVTGDSGVLKFGFRDPDSVANVGLDTALATGTRAEVQVKAVSGDRLVKIARAETDAADIAAVHEDYEAIVVVDGVAAGTTTLTVETQDGLSDAVALRVADAAQVTLRSLQPTDRVLVGGTEPFTLNRADARGTRLMGEAAVSATVEPASAGEQVNSAPSRVHVRYLAAGMVTISAGDSTLEREVVGLDAVAEFKLLPVAGEGPFGLDDEILVGYQIKDAAGATLGALLDLVQVETRGPPDVCAVEEGDVLGVVGFRVRPIGAGECTVVATLGALTQNYTIQLTE